MSASSGAEPLLPVSRRQAVVAASLVLLRATVSVTVLTAVYFLLPVRREGSDVILVLAQLAAFGVVVAIQVPAIVRARHPILRAVEALLVLVPLYLLIFARLYLVTSVGDPAAFSESLDHVSALYFTVTVFATVGFGDIVAQSDSPRVLVIVQMLLNLVVLGLVIRLLTAAARRGVAGRDGWPDA